MKITSEVVRESIPTHNLNFIILEKEIIDEHTVKLIWEYPDDYWDLAGFRLFLNGEIIADHTKIGPEVRIYSFRIRERNL